VTRRASSWQNTCINSPKVLYHNRQRKTTKAKVQKEHGCKNSGSVNMKKHQHEQNTHNELQMTALSIILNCSDEE